MRRMQWDEWRRGHCAIPHDVHRPRIPSCNLACRRSFHMMSTNPAPIQHKSRPKVESYLNVTGEHQSARPTPRCLGSLQVGSVTPR